MREGAKGEGGGQERARETVGAETRGGLAQGVSELFSGVGVIADWFLPAIPALGREAATVWLVRASRRRPSWRGQSVQQANGEADLAVRA